MSKYKKVRELSIAKSFAIGGAILGLFLGILYSFGGVIVDFFNQQLGFGTVLAFGALLGMPLIFASFGFILGLIGAFFYNIIQGLRDG